MARQRSAEQELPQERAVLTPTLVTVKAGLNFAKKKPLGAFGAIVLAVMVIIAVFAPWIAPFDPSEPYVERTFSAPGTEFLLGGDQIGRDILSRLIYGARISLFVGLVSVTIGISLGSLLGVVSAYFGSKIDLVVQRLVDAFLAFPAIILGLTLDGCPGVFCDQHHHRSVHRAGARVNPHRPVPSVGGQGNGLRAGRQGHRSK